MRGRRPYPERSPGRSPRSVWDGTRLAAAAFLAGGAWALAIGAVTAQAQPAAAQAQSAGAQSATGAAAAGAAEEGTGEEGAAHLDHGLLTGTWQRYRPKSFKINPQFTTSIAPPSDPPLKEPYLSQWKARRKAAHEADLRGQPVFTGYAQCLPDGMPAMMMAMFPMEVLQTPGQITIIEEAYRQVRYIYLGEKQIAIGDAEPEFWGHSVGRWEGDTLHVDTVGIKEEVRFSDVPHSDRMRIDERIRLLSRDRFEDRITVVDPAYLTKPWTWTWEYQRDPGYKMLEYVCEDNREYRDPSTGGQRVELIDSSGHVAH